jgi:hypothetical protein
MISYKELKDAVKALNALDIEDLNVLRSVGVKRTILEQQFIEEVERIAEDNEEILPDEVITVFNSLIGDENAKEPEEEEAVEEEAVEEEVEPEEEEVEEEEAPKKKAPRKAKPSPAAKPEKKEKAEKKGAKRSRYNHIQDALSGKLDDLLYQGDTVTDIMDELGLTRSRVMSHIKHLVNDRGLTVKETPGDTLNETFFKVKEKLWKQP